MYSKVSISEDDRTLYGLPSDYIVGQAVADGSCFFDSFRQGLIALRSDEIVTVTTLREICADVARSPPLWLIDLLNHTQITPDIVRSETPAEYVERVLLNGSWGEPEIEGRILCAHFNVELVVLEAHGDLGVTRSLITGDRDTCSSNEPFNKPNTIYIINRGSDHFEPLLKVNIENLNSTSSSIVEQNSVTETKNIGISTNKSIDKTKVVSSESMKNSVSSKKKTSPPTEPVISVNKSSPIFKPVNLVNKSLPDNICNLIRIHKFEKVHSAIMNCDLKLLEESLAEHRNVLHNLPPDPTLVQLSLRQAVLSSNTRVLDLLYDHWASAAQTSHHNHYIKNLKQLDKALNAACNGLQTNQLLVDAYCIIEYNTFQIQLYQELLDLQIYTLDLDQDNRQQQLQQIKYILITAIELYIEFSDKFVSLSNNELIEKLSFNEFIEMQVELGTPYSARYALYSLFELYYRKLDFCIVSIILKYVHALKLRLKLPENTYQEVECTVYYFIYRWNEDWRLYLSESWIQRRNSVITSTNASEYLKVLCDPDKVLNGSLVFLEWTKFKETVTNFKVCLEQTSIPDNIRVEGTKLPTKEVHSLTLLPYLRDEYSLQKMVKYLEACSQVIKSYPTESRVLIVQRVLQLTGEFIKSSPKTLHLSSTTKALLQIHIPRSVFQQLITLRDDFSHLKYGKLIRRIHIEETNPNVILGTINDLENIKGAINKVIEIYKPIVEMTLIDQGLNLVAERQKQLPVSLSEYLLITQKMFSTVGDENYVDELIEQENEYTEEDWAKLGITKIVYKEHRHLVHHILTLKKERVNRDNNCIQSMINNLPTYLEYMHNIIEDIEKNIKSWDSIKKEVEDLPTKCSILDDPNKDCIKNIKSIIKKHSRTHPDLISSLQKKLDNIIIDWSFQWSTICEFMTFIIHELSILKYHPKEIKRGEFTSMLTSITARQPNSEGVTTVRKLLDVIKQDIDKYCLKYKLSAVPTKPKVYHYKGLEQLTESMSKKWFLTTKETSYLKDTISKMKCKCSNKKCTHQPLVEKILCGEPISSKERDIVISQYDLDDTSKQNIENLVIGNNNRNGCSLQCLLTRTKTLKNAFGNNKLTQLIQRFYQDIGFRLLVEAIIADIQVLFVERGLRRLLDTSTSRLLIDYPLRNILEHGNPLLDVIGEKLDSRSAVDTLFRFALLVVEDEPVLSQLYDLHERGVKHDQIQNEWTGPLPSRLQDYLLLLPNKNEDKADQCSNKDQNVSNSPKENTASQKLKKLPQTTTGSSGIATVSESVPTIAALTPKSFTTSKFLNISATLKTSSSIDITRESVNEDKITNSIAHSSPLETESKVTNNFNTSHDNATSSSDTARESPIDSKVPNLNILEAIGLAASQAASAASAAASAASAASMAAASAATAAATLANLCSQLQSNV